MRGRYVPRRGIYVGFAGQFAKPLCHDASRVEQIAKLLLDRRWPFPLTSGYVTYAEKVAQRSRKAQYKGRNAVASLQRVIANPAHDVLQMDARENEDFVPADARLHVGPRALPREAECPFDVAMTTRGDALPDGADVHAWIDLAHEMAVACGVASAVLPVWPTMDKCISDVAMMRVVLDTPAGSVDVGASPDFVEQNSRANYHRIRLGATYVRHPRWGTYLGPQHVARIGGIERVREVVAPARIAEVGELTFIQLTESVRTALEPECERKRQLLAQVMEPILPPARRAA